MLDYLYDQKNHHVHDQKNKYNYKLDQLELNKYFLNDILLHLSVE